MSDVFAEPIEADEVAATARSLPALSQTTTQIHAILADESFDIQDLLRVISLDSSLAAKLLRMANSARHAGSQPTASLQEALIRLGSGAIMTAAFAEIARPSDEIDLSSFQLTAEQYWQHCISAVAAAEELSARNVAGFGPGFTVAVLLHDFGKTILARHITPSRLRRMEAFRAANVGLSPVDVERRILGIDHAMAGGMVARHWNLPSDVATAIENHHNPCDWGQTLTNGVVLADQLAYESVGKQTFSLGASEIVADAMLALNLDDSTYESVAAASRSRYQVLLNLFC
ncbi:MAG: HDOD domain-containing protein [Fuerstiella sp.]